MWVGTILGTVIIFGFWLWSLSISLAESADFKANDKNLQSLEKIKKEVPGLWESLSAGIGSVIETAKEELTSSPSATPAAESPVIQPEAERLPIEQ